MAKMVGRGSLLNPSFISGQKHVIAKLNKELMAIPFKSKQALNIAGFKIMRRSMQLTPVDTSALVKSHYKRDVSSSIIGPVIEIGLTAAYAPYVHERLDLRHSVGQAKFLETAITELADDIIDTIRQYTRIN